MRLFTFLLISGILLITSCSKNTEKKITGSYEMNTYYRNGFVFTAFFHSAFPNWRMELKNNGNFTETFGSYTIIGTWEVTENGKQLTLVQINGVVRPYDILDHSKTSLEVEETDSDGNLNRFVLDKL